MKKNVIPIIFGGIAIAGVSFFGGMIFGKRQGLTRKNFASRFDTNMSKGQGEQRIGGQGRIGGGGNSGKILSLDEKSITIELPDGGSKIIYFSDTTEVVKSTSGFFNDLIIGDQVTVMGTTNDDGSVSAKVIQVRPEIFSDNN
ncbi:MAG: hypothetical protein UU48_C0006G0146 [Candidatus Uhrbacteria bacterium GW2011_GWF2_41_16]|jgi:hypothetical protein|uniref:DUF5666 domain-containing protein n=2 Tax=Candidatus Uhriibacteriota TaxID=1752732 RepID=A0A0G0VEM3_9BACT|nr:MAG: hypothetical protein UU31_C0002G0003 [Candidatus Uhrbacteria bacterium GW2011_GWA2_41_10]KKR86728.1 MAG: hypothetical protein UU35_C0009G0015 [Candidatus Uhrbacteria bacterium GW2011_GWC2_41_11]KKR98106.1 MAG: hypothetical protein UU48_C0006G0146 [Candidatus Uhrbacteria bacterium GW2011_GWF2_41_16]HBP00332.1 hypothetical protein [Candidatus Uhrbacteria bacterium]